MCQVLDLMGQILSSNHAYIGYNLAAVGVAAAIAALGATLLGVPPVWLSIAVLIWISLWALAAGLLSDETTRRKLSVQLDAPNYTQLYSFLTKSVVNGLWKQLCDPVTRKGQWRPYFRAALTWRLYDRALLIALVYPLLLLVGQWMITGAERRVGDFVALPETDFWPLRAVTLAAIAILITGIIGEKLAGVGQCLSVRQPAGSLVLIVTET